MPIISVEMKSVKHFSSNLLYNCTCGKQKKQPIRTKQCHEMAVIVTQTNHENVGGKRGHKKLESNPKIITSSANNNYSVITGQIAGHKYAPSC